MRKLLTVMFILVGFFSYSQNAFEEYMILKIKPQINEEIETCEMSMITNDQLIALNDCIVEDGILTVDILPYRDYYFLINGKYDFTLTPGYEIVDERDLSISANSTRPYFKDSVLMLDFILNR